MDKTDTLATLRIRKKWKMKERKALDGQIADLNLKIAEEIERIEYDEMAADLGITPEEARESDRRGHLYVAVRQEEAPKDASGLLATVPVQGGTH